MGMHRALDSAIGLPRRSTSALSMLLLLMPAEVSRNLMMSFLYYKWSRKRPPDVTRRPCKDHGPRQAHANHDPRPQ